MTQQGRIISKKNLPFPSLLVKENDNSSSALNSLNEEKEVSRVEEEDIGEDEDFRVHEGTRFKGQGRQ